jgi:hypothetical protein
VCKDVQTDPLNCGACGNACTNGLQCVGGTCTCPPGWLSCAGQCTNVQTDTKNCGACGTTCASDKICGSGVCQCPSGTAPCNGICTDTVNDPANCGGCGSACSAGLDCTLGSCGCAPGKVACSGQCKDTQTDAANCGACGNACPSGKTCEAGACLSASCVLFEETFSGNSKGWTLGTEWAIGPTKISTGHQLANPDPAQDHSPSSDNGVAGVVLGGNSTTLLHDYYYLVSPVIDATSATSGLELRFYRWLNTDYATFQSAVVEVFDGSKWVKLFDSVTAPTPADAAWMPITVDLSSYVSNNLQVRFGYANLKDPVYAVSNWNVDDVRLVKKSCN